MKGSGENGKFTQAKYEDAYKANLKDMKEWSEMNPALVEKIRKRFFEKAKYGLFPSLHACMLIFYQKGCWPCD